MSENIEKRLSQLAESIRGHLKLKDEIKGLKKMVASVAGFALLGLVIVKAPVFALAFFAFGTMTAASMYLERTNKEKLDKVMAEREKLIEEMAKKSAAYGMAAAPLNGHDNKTSFDAAARIAQLEKEVKDLREEVSGKPVVLDKPKRQPKP